LNHLTLPVMRIVLFLLAVTTATCRVVKPYSRDRHDRLEPVASPEQKKRPQTFAAFPLRRQARPASER
jgi:hypothetical protein